MPRGNKWSHGRWVSYGRYSLCTCIVVVAAVVAAVVVVVAAAVVAVVAAVVEANSAEVQ